MSVEDQRRADERMAAKVAQWGPDVLRYVEKSILVQTLDHLWREHLVMLEHLRQVIGLRGYGQRDPLVEYKKESFELFEGLMSRIEEDTIRFLFYLQVQPVDEQKQAEEEERRRRRQQMMLDRQQTSGGSASATEGTENQVKRDAPKVGRNDPCPCGSGKKYKQCHGVNA